MTAPGRDGLKWQGKQACPACGKVTYSFLHSCPGVPQLRLTARGRDGLSEAIDREWMRPEHDCDGTDRQCAERCPRPAYQRMGLDELRDAAVAAVEAEVAARVAAARAEERERAERHYAAFVGSEAALAQVVRERDDLDERANRAEAEAHNAQADYDRRGERLWRLAALAGHVADESDNDATAELVVTEVLTDAQRAIGVLRRERDALAAMVERARALVDEWERNAERETVGVVRRESLAVVGDLRVALDAPAPEQAAGEGERS